MIQINCHQFYFTSCFPSLFSRLSFQLLINGILPSESLKECNFLIKIDKKLYHIDVSSVLFIYFLFFFFPSHTIKLIRWCGYRRKKMVWVLFDGHKICYKKPHSEISKSVVKKNNQKLFLYT